MNVLIYTHAFAPQVGGVETFAMLLAEGLAAQPDVAVTLATPAAASGFDDAALGFRVLRQPGVGVLWRLIGETDVVQLAGPAMVPLTLALARRKPVVIEHHGYQARCPNGLLFYEPTKTACPGHFQARRYHQCLACNAATAGWLRSAWLLLLTFPRRWLCARAARNVPVTRHVLHRLELPRSQVIYNGIPGPPDGVAAPAPRLGAPPVIGYVGRLVQEKALPVLLEAAKGLAARGYDFRMRLVGDGPERARLEGLVAQAGLAGRVEFTGFLQGKALEEAAGSIDVVVIPTIMEETAGLAAMEQMMRGRAVVASDIGGLGEVCEGAGLKFPPGDAEALAARLESLLAEPARIAEIGHRARAAALERFTQERMAAEYLALYRASLGDS